MELVRMVVGVITEEQRGVPKVLTVYRNPITERCFGGRVFLPGCVMQPGEERGELELLADEFSDRLGVQFGLEVRLKGWGEAVGCDLDGVHYNILPLKGRLSSYEFKAAPGVVGYDLIQWASLHVIRTFKAGGIMAKCLKQFELW